jgi:hypothetical protein
MNGSSNTTAYFKKVTITAVKSFMVQAPGPNVIKIYGRNLRIFVISECLSLAGLSSIVQHSPMLVRKARSLLK